MPLVVRWYHTPAQYRPLASTAIHPRDRVRLRQVLRSVIDIENLTDVGLQNRILVLEAGFEIEEIRIGITASGHGVTCCHIDLVAYIVIKVILVGSNARVLERIDRDRRGQVFRAVAL